MLDAWLRDHLVCPRDEQPLVERDGSLTCLGGHTYPCVHGIPIMLVRDTQETHWIASYSLEHLHEEPPPLPSDGIDPFVRQAVPATCGHLYARVGETMSRYPLPRFPLVPRREEETLLDVGCSWGRWSVSAALCGFRVVGIDPSLPAIHAACRVSAQLGAKGVFVVGDARWLPFRRGTFGTVFSYSVLQHFSPADFRLSLEEAGRVLDATGRAMVQMPNKFGMRNLLQQVRRGWASPKLFEVRYWSPKDLKDEVERAVGPTTLTVDGYFSLNAQTSDVALLPKTFRSLVRLSERLRRLSERYRFLVYAADSVYLLGTRVAAGAPSAAERVPRLVT